MTPIQILKKAQEGQYAVGQFNISTGEQLRAIIEAARELQSPVIIGTSESERSFIGIKQIVALVNTWQEETNIPVILNADHCKSFESVKEAVDAGYSAVHFDGSGLDFNKNIEITRQVVEYAKSKNPDIVVEGELGYLRGGSEIHKEIEIKPEDLTKPDQAKEFIEKTKVDSLAIAVGNIHGIEVDLENPHLYLEKIKEIQKNVPSTFLVLHGGSGTPEEDIKEAIKLGVVKVNVNTELRIAFVNALKKSLAEQSSEIKPYKILAYSVNTVRETVKEKIKLFGSQGKI